MTGFLRSGKGRAALIALALASLALSLTPTVAQRPAVRFPDGRGTASNASTGLRPDWVRLPPAVPAGPTLPPTAVEPTPTTPPAEQPLVAPASPAPLTAIEAAPAETIDIAAVASPTEAPPPAAPPIESPVPPPAPAVAEGPDPAFAAAIVELTNEARLANDLAPLAEQPALVAAAQEYADLHARISPDRLDHGLNGSTLDSRAEAEGYTGWTFLAENLVWTSFQPPLSPAETVQQWLDSPAHRGNILNPTIKETGVGCYVSVAGRPFRICVQEFGARA